MTRPASYAASLSYMADRTAVLNIRLRPELRDALEELANAEDLTISAYARRVLARHAEETTRRA